jgi:hypothetical protein
MHAEKLIQEFTADIFDLASYLAQTWHPERHFDNNYKYIVLDFSALSTLAVFLLNLSLWILDSTSNEFCNLLFADKQQRSCKNALRNLGLYSFIVTPKTYIKGQSEKM